MNISIDKPCHENWDKMTPNEQGAFCGVCTKNVIDFSKKSLEEIKAFFSTPSKGKLCGRFTEDQLDDLNTESFVERFLGFKLGRKVAVLSALTFIAILLTAKPAAAQDGKHVVMGKMKAPVTNTVTPVKTGEVQVDTTDRKPKKHIKGDVKAQPADPTRKGTSSAKNKTLVSGFKGAKAK